MTFLDQQTEVLPESPPSEEFEPARVRWGVIVVVVVAAFLVLLATALVTAETIARAEGERAIAREVRTGIDLSASERIQVDIPGSVLLQELSGRFDDIVVTVYSYPTGLANADLSLVLSAVRRIDGGWAPENVSGAAILSAAQATALFVPAEAQSVARIGFSGGDMVVSGTVTGGATSLTMSVATTPRFENGRLSAAISAVTINGKALSVDEVAAQTGADLSTLQSAPVCLAELVPSFVHPRDVRIDDGHLRIEYDIDVAASETAAGRAPGSCP